MGSSAQAHRFVAHAFEHVSPGGWFGARTALVPLALRVDALLHQRRAARARLWPVERCDVKCRLGTPANRDRVVEEHADPFDELFAKRLDAKLLDRFCFSARVNSAAQGLLELLPLLSAQIGSQLEREAVALTWALLFEERKREDGEGGRSRSRRCPRRRRSRGSGGYVAPRFRTGWEQEGQQHRASNGSSPSEPTLRQARRPSLGHRRWQAVRAHHGGHLGWHRTFVRRIEHATPTSRAGLSPAARRQREGRVVCRRQSARHADASLGCPRFRGSHHRRGRRGGLVDFAATGGGAFLLRFCKSQA